MYIHIYIYICRCMARSPLSCPNHPPHPPTPMGPGPGPFIEPGPGGPRSHGPGPEWAPLGPHELGPNAPTWAFMGWALPLWALVCSGLVGTPRPSRASPRWAPLEPNRQGPDGPPEALMSQVLMAPSGPSWVQAVYPCSSLALMAWWAMRAVRRVPL